MANKKRKAAKAAALASRIAAATPLSSLSVNPTLDTLGNTPLESGEVAYQGKKGKWRFLSADQLNQFVGEHPGRTQEQYATALWNDSTGNPNSRFGQFEERLLAEANPSEAQRGLDRTLAAQRADKAANIATGVMQRRVRATGIKQDARELESMQRQMGISRVLNRVDAQNAADQAMDARRDMVRDYSFDAEGSSQNAIGGALASSAQAEMERKISKRAKGAASAAGNASMAGQIAGLAISAFAASASSFKENIEPAPSILEGLARLDLKKWQYVGEDEAHVGPMAEEFQQVFGIGDGKTLKLVDVMGVMIGAIKEMAALTQRAA